MYFWFGLQYDCQTEDIDHPSVGVGALKTFRWHDGRPVADGRNRGQWRALKDVVGDLIDDGVFTEQEAIGYMKAKIIKWARPDEDLIIRTAPHSDGP